jgi:putative membrane protein
VSIQAPPSEETLNLNRLNTYLANERTFLAWIRTSIGIMAFGFVVEKFTLFMRQISFFFLSKADSPATSPASVSPEISPTSSLGIILVGLGVFICFLAFLKFKKIEKQIREGRFEHSILLEVMLMLSILSVGIFLSIYLLHSLHI